MSESRGLILERVRRSLASARLPPLTSGKPTPAPPPGNPDELLEAFRREVQGLAGRVHLATSPEAGVRCVMDIVRATEAREILAWDQAQLPLAGLGEALAEAGIRRLDSRLPAEAEARRARLAELGQAEVGVTGAEAALADTGSLVLSSGPGRSRLAWLLPPRHIALLPLARLYPGLDAALEAHPGLQDDAAEVALVSGPSRTADIELTLTRGVHGPRDLDVVILV